MGRVDWPHNREVTSGVRVTGLRLLLCAMALGTLLASSALAQVLEGTILLPDSLGPLAGKTCVALDESPAHPRMFIGSDSGDVLVVNSPTGERVARVETGPVKSICFCPTQNKLYISLVNEYAVVAIDCSSYQTITKLQLGSLVTGLVYNPLVDRVYCATWHMKVIDCATDSIVDSLPIPARNAIFALDTIHNKLYVGATDTFRVVDCSANSIVASIHELRGAQALCFAPSASGDKVYVGVGDTLFALDVKTDTVVYRRKFGTANPVIACDPERGRVYCAYNSSVYAFNCADDSMIWNSYTGGLIGLAAVPVENKVYALSSSYLLVLDGESGQQLTGFDYVCRGLHLSTLLNRAFLTDGDRSVRAIDCSTDTMVSVIPYGAFVGFLRSSVVVDSVDNKLYFSAGAAGVGVVDCATNKVTSYICASHLPYWTWPPSLAYHSRGNKLYVRVDSSLFVYDCKADTLTKAIPVGTFADYPTWQMELDPDQDRLYVVSELTTAYDYQLWVIDCAKDSVRKVIHLPLELPLYGAFLSPELEQLWMMRAGYTVIDCRGDSVLVDTNPGLAVRSGSYDPVSRKVYAASFTDLYAIDMETLLPLDSLHFTPANQGWTRQVYCARQARKVYWMSENDQYMQESDSVFAVDIDTDSIVSRFTVPWQSYGVCGDRTEGYVYFASASGYLVAVDPRTDSCVSGVHIPLRAQCLVRNGATNRLYIAGGTDSVIQVVYDSIIFAGVQNDSGNPAQVERLQTIFSRGAPLYSPADAMLYDASGCRVAVLRFGPNDMGRLSPGVYFLAVGSGAASPTPRAIRKIIVAR